MDLANQLWVSLNMTRAPSNFSADQRAFVRGTWPTYAEGQNQGAEGHRHRPKPRGTTAPDAAPACWWDPISERLRKALKSVDETRAIDNGSTTTTGQSSRRANDDVARPLVPMWWRRQWHNESSKSSEYQQCMCCSAWA